MRKRIFAAAFLATTALTPAPARAEPITAAVAAINTFFASAAVTAGASAAVATAFASVATQFVIGVGLSAVASLLRPKPEVPKPSARMVNYAQPLAYQERVYGRVRKGGPIGFTGFSDDRRLYNVILAAHSILGVAEHWLDERKVTFDGSGVCETVPPGDEVRARIYTGQPGQSADPVLMEAFEEWTADHDMTGLAYASLEAHRVDQEEFNEDYPTGREPAYNPVINGNDRIWDPRTQNRVFTRNLALCLAHELVTYWGYSVDWDDVAAEADICDEMVATADGDQIPRWRLDGVLSDDQEFEDVRAQMIAAGDVFLFERPDGKVGFRVGRWIAPTVTLTERDFLSLTYSDVQDPGAPNEFVMQYVEPENDWREAQSGVWVHDPSGRRIRDEISGFMLSHHNQAARILKRLAAVERAKIKLSGTLKLSGYNLIGQRFAMFTHSELGVSFPIEIGKLTWGADRSTFGLEAHSAAAEDFDFDAATEEPERPVRAPLAEATPVAEGLEGFQAVAEQSTGGTAALRFSWGPTPLYVRQRLRYRIKGETEWNVVEVGKNATSHLATGLQDGAIYEAQIRNFGYSVLSSDWTPAIEVQAIANTTPPGALSDFALAAVSGNVQVSFVAPNDEAYFATRIYRGTAAGGFGAATLVRTEYGIPSNSDAWIDAGATSGTAHTYWAEPINASGVPGVLAGPETITLPNE